MMLTSYNYAEQFYDKKCNCLFDYKSSLLDILVYVILWSYMLVKMYYGKISKWL